MGGADKLLKSGTTPKVADFGSGSLFQTYLMSNFRTHKHEPMEVVSFDRLNKWYEPASLRRLVGVRGTGVFLPPSEALEVLQAREQTPVAAWPHLPDKMFTNDRDGARN